LDNVTVIGAKKCWYILNVNGSGEIKDIWCVNEEMQIKHSGIDVTVRETSSQAGQSHCEIITRIN
jgi:hypothetical protein